jgi:hypothetical protein
VGTQLRGVEWDRLGCQVLDGRDVSSSGHCFILVKAQDLHREGAYTT